jgi:hypothetical protein
MLQSATCPGRRVFHCLWHVHCIFHIAITFSLWLVSCERMLALASPDQLPISSTNFGKWLMLCSSICVPKSASFWLLVYIHFNSEFPIQGQGYAFFSNCPTLFKNLELVFIFTPELRSNMWRTKPTMHKKKNTLYNWIILYLVMHLSTNLINKREILHFVFF